MGTFQQTKVDVRSWIMLGFGLFLVVGGAVPIITQLLTTDLRTAAAHISLILFWSLAWLTVGSIVGFLFGTPSSADGESSNTGPSYRPFGKNLRDIADWLTKIIAGVTLVQLREIPDDLEWWGQKFERALGSPGTSLLGIELIIYFVLLGFLAFYFLTRFYIFGALYKADQSIFVNKTDLSEDQLNNFKEGIIEVEASLPDDPSLEGDQDTDQLKNLKKSATEIVKVPTTQLDSAEDWRLWAYAQRLLGQYERAISGYHKALEMERKNPRFRLEYAQTLSSVGADYEKIFRQLVIARRNLSSSDSDALVRKIYEWLTFFSLYLEEPKSYTLTIAYGEKYNKRYDYGSPRIYANLAAAYGQKATALVRKGQEKDTQEFKDLRDKALEAIEKAIEISDVPWKDILFELWAPGQSYREVKAEDKDPFENDLEVFFEDSDFIELFKNKLKLKESNAPADPNEKQQ